MRIWLDLIIKKELNKIIDWQKIPQRLQQFCDFVNNVRKTTNTSNVNEIYKLSFLAHYELASIHPWADKNGRMARLVMNMLQKKNLE